MAVPKEITIRKATRADLAALLPQFRAYQEHYGTLTSATEEQTRDFLSCMIDDPNAGFILIAISDGLPCGFAAVYFTVSGLIAQRLAHLGDLYVVPAFRKQDIGSTLFEAASCEAHSHGIRLMRWLSVSSNAPVNAWYSKMVRPVGTFELYLRPTEANKSLQPTATAVTPPASQEIVPAVAVAEH